MAKKPPMLHVPRYYLFVGCDDPGCQMEVHEHDQGWDLVATRSDDLEEIRKATMAIDENHWWHLVDILTGSIILRSSDAGYETH